MINRTLAPLSLGSWPPCHDMLILLSPSILYIAVHAPKSSNLLRHQWAGPSPNDQRRPLLGFAACACLPNPPHPVPASCHAISQASTSQARDGLATVLYCTVVIWNDHCVYQNGCTVHTVLGLVQLRGSGCIQEALGGSACMQDPYFPSPVARVVCDR